MRSYAETGFLMRKSSFKVTDNCEKPGFFGVHAIVLIMSCF
ncbi:MAG: hypothetical protein ACRCT1_07720 [Microcoleaceae cyanobacterium]